MRYYKVTWKKIPCYPTGIYLFKVNNGNDRAICEIYSELRIETPDYVIDIVLLSLLLTLNIFHRLFWCKSGYLETLIILLNIRKVAQVTQVFETSFINRNSIFNPFHATDLFWYSLKTSENIWFSDVFREYQKRSVAWNGLVLLMYL